MRPPPPLADVVCVTELHALLTGRKPAQRHTLDASRFEVLERFYRRLGLFVDHSDFRLDFGRGLSERLPLDASRGELIVYASRDRKAVSRLKLLEDRATARTGYVPGAYERYTTEIGRLLGYPDCCIAFFLDHHLEPTPRIYFAAHAATRSTARAELNVIDEQPLVSHVPCSFDCTPSLAYAEGLAADMGELSPLAELRGGYLLFYNGVFVRSVPRGEGEAHWFEPVKDFCGWFGGGPDDHPLIRHALDLARAGARLVIRDGKLDFFLGEEDEARLRLEPFGGDSVFIEFV